VDIGRCPCRSVVRRAGAHQRPRHRGDQRAAAIRARRQPGPRYARPRPTTDWACARSPVHETLTVLAVGRAIEKLEAMGRGPEKWGSLGIDVVSVMRFRGRVVRVAGEG
jgi:hypothetical protein